MTWITYSFLMFTASIGLYLVVRKSSLEKVPTQLTNLAMFGIPLIAYVGIGLVQQASLVISWQNLVVILIAAAFFGYGGNKASLHAIEKAPNPGYSLVLSKSYVLFTTIVAIFLFSAVLTLQNAIAIIMIVLFSALVMLTRKNIHETRSNTWVMLSIIAFFSWGMLSLSSKYLFSHNVDTITFLIYLYVIVTLCIVAFDRVKPHTITRVSVKSKYLLLATGVFSTLFNLGQFEAIRLAPNLGYVNAINASSIAAVTIFAVLLFHDELTKTKAIGIIGVTAGLVLLLV